MLDKKKFTTFKNERGCSIYWIDSYCCHTVSLFYSNLKKLFRIIEIFGFIDYYLHTNEPDYDYCIKENLNIYVGNEYKKNNNSSSNYCCYNYFNYFTSSTYKIYAHSKTQSFDETISEGVN